MPSATHPAWFYHSSKIRQAVLRENVRFFIFYCWSLLFIWRTPIITTELDTRGRNLTASAMARLPINSETSVQVRPVPCVVNLKTHLIGYRNRDLPAWSLNHYATACPSYSNEPINHNFVLIPLHEQTRLTRNAFSLRSRLTECAYVCPPPLHSLYDHDYWRKSGAAELIFAVFICISSRTNEQD
jgi:hypothetical protein